MGNFEKMRDVNSLYSENQKIVKGYKVMDIVGKGAFGIVYEVEKDGIRYAMKEIAMSQYDHTYEQIQKEDLEDGKDLDQIVSDNISKEVSILK